MFLALIYKHSIWFKTVLFKHALRIFTFSLDFTKAWVFIFLITFGPCWILVHYTSLKFSVTHQIVSMKLRYLSQALSIFYCKIRFMRYFVKHINFLYMSVPYQFLWCKIEILLSESRFLVLHILNVEIIFFFCFFVRHVYCVVLAFKAICSHYIYYYK